MIYIIRSHGPSAPAAVDLGPTAIIPGTQYTSVDREGFHNSEERLTPFLRPPENSASAAQPAEAWQALAAAEAEFNSPLTPEEADQTRMEHAVEMLGDPR
jgi:hypothetical protein